MIELVEIIRLADIKEAPDRGGVPFSLQGWTAVPLDGGRLRRNYRASYVVVSFVYPLIRTPNRVPEEYHAYQVLTF